MAAKISDLMPSNGNYVFSFYIEGGVANLFALVKDGNYIFGLRAGFQGSLKYIYSDDNGQTWTST